MLALVFVVRGSVGNVVLGGGFVGLLVFGFSYFVGGVSLVS